MFRRTRVLVAAALLLSAAVFAPFAHAGTFVGDEVYTLGADETSDGNLYAFGNTVLIEGTVNGDLITAGGDVTIGSGATVNGDLWAAGRQVLVEGTIEGDVRGAGFLVVVAEGASVAGEFLGAGFHLGLEAGAEVDDDFSTAGAQTKLEGSVGGDARIAGSSVLLAGPIAGDVDLQVEGGEGGAAPMMFWPNMPQPPSMATGLVVAETARVGGDLNLDYVGSDEPDISAAVVAGEITTDVRGTATDEEPRQPLVIRYGLAVLGRFLALIVVGALGLWLAPKLIERVHTAMAAAPLPAAGWGCLTAILVPVALSVLAVVTLFLLILLGKLPFDVAPIIFLSGLLGSTLFFGALMAVWIGMAVAGLWIGRVLLRRLGSDAAGKWSPLLLGCLVVALLVQIPFYIGAALAWVIGLVGLGAMVVAYQRRVPAPPPSSPFEGMVPAA